MNQAKKTGSLALMAIVSCAVVAFAADKPRIKPLLTPVHKTQTSGPTGGEEKVGDGVGFLWAIEWTERGDSPCWMQMHTAYREQNAATWTHQSAEHSNGACTRHDASRKSLYLQDPSNGGESPRFVRSIQVCTSDKKESFDEKLKGIRIKSARYDSATNKFIPENAVEEARRNHCKEWHQEVSCPDGQAATALYVNVGKSNRAVCIALQAGNPAARNQPRASAGRMARRAASSARSKVSDVRAAAFLSSAFSFDQARSMGLRSGE
jgi:hypothetical protein